MSNNQYPITRLKALFKSHPFGGDLEGASPSKSAKWFCLKYDLALSFVRTHNAYIRMKLVIHLIGKWLIGGFLKAIFHKEDREYLYNILKKPKLIQAHLINYKKYFS